MGLFRSIIECHSNAVHSWLCRRPQTPGSASLTVSETRTTWSLRTPAEPGVYRIAVAFYYGTEKAHPLGTVIKNGRPEPRGGMNGPSGRIMFSSLFYLTAI